MGRMYRAVRLYNENKCVDVVAFVDTGADRTIISDRIARALGVSRVGKDTLTVANREILETDIGTVRVESINDNISQEMIVDISDEPFEDGDEENIEMIIGIDFLQENNMRLRFGVSSKK